MLHLSATTIIEKERERERERRSVCSDMCTQQIEVFMYPQLPID